MLQGKVNAAMQLVTHGANGGVLSLNDLIPMEIRQNGEPIQQMTRDILLEKHPKGNQQQMTHYWMQVQQATATNRLFMSR